MEPGWVIWNYFWLEIVMVRRSVDQMDFGSGGQKLFLLSLTARSRVSKCTDRGLDGIGGRQDARKCWN